MSVNLKFAFSFEYDLLIIAIEETEVEALCFLNYRYQQDTEELLRLATSISETLDDKVNI